jgi:DNA mismatch endonuclease (patch repair protein)
MSDVLDRETRSRVMSAIRSRGNKSTELAMAAILRQLHLIGWRRHLKIMGKPDFAWPRIQLALFVDGCFWHGCPFCRRPPKSNIAFWRKKIGYNQLHDRKVVRSLRAQGWSVLRVRECCLHKPLTARRIERTYKSLNQRFRSC